MDIWLDQFINQVSPEEVAEHLRHLSQMRRRRLEFEMNSEEGHDAADFMQK